MSDSARDSQIEKIDNSLVDMMDAKLDLAEKYYRFELTA